MFEKVNPAHPDKVADRIAGAIVDLAYKQAENPRIAVEVLIGHGKCHIIAETSVFISEGDVIDAVHRIAGEIIVDYKEVPQDIHLAYNQTDRIRCGDMESLKAYHLLKSKRNYLRLLIAFMQSIALTENISLMVID